MNIIETPWLQQALTKLMTHSGDLKADNLDVHGITLHFFEARALANYVQSLTQERVVTDDKDTLRSLSD